MNLLIGSTEAFSGKSAIALGLALHLRAKNIAVRYAKPLGNLQVGGEDEDCLFVQSQLGATVPVLPPLAFLDRGSVRRRLNGEDTVNYVERLPSYGASQAGGLCLIEAAGTPQEGALYGLTLQALAEHLPARVLVVSRYHTDLVIDHLLALRQQLGNRLLGVILNDVPEDHLEDVCAVLVPFIESQGIGVFGVLPADRILRSLSVEALAHALGAEVLCCPDRLDLMVESFNIGAMSVNAALKYFRKSENKAVITGGDRTDIQLAALETSTTCLILTGHLPPTAGTLARAEQLEVPILSVNHDTLATVEIIERIFGQVRFREPIKVKRIQKLLERNFDFVRFEKLLGLGN